MRIWDAETGLLAAPPFRSQGAIVHAEVRSGGTQIATLNLVLALFNMLPNSSGLSVSRIALREVGARIWYRLLY